MCPSGFSVLLDIKGVCVFDIFYLFLCVCVCVITFGFYSPQSTVLYKPDIPYHCVNCVILGFLGFVSLRIFNGQYSSWNVKITIF